ncbi:MAG: thiamine pyrophosphate-dependent enzyme, partial [Chloroflexota bacterium]
LINQAERPVILAGRGVLISDACSELKQFAEKAQIPVATAHLGISSFPETHFLSLGKIGMHGTMYGNLAVNNSDLVIGIGTRFSDRTTGKASSFCPMAKVIHIDIDPSEIGKNIVPDVPIVGDVKNVLQVLIEQMTPREHVEWLRQIEEWRQEHPSRQVRESENLLPQYVIQQIYEITHGEAIVVTGVGQNQMWAAQHYFYSRPNSLISSGGLGTMGFELPAAIGAQIGCPDKVVWSVAGDGGFQMTLHELATVTQERIPLKIAIINNGYLGMVRQWQEMFYGRRYVATPLSGPDFVKIADAYGIAALRVKQKDEVVPALQKAMNTAGPFLIDFMVEPEENVFPMIPPGASISQTMELPREQKTRL